MNQTASKPQARSFGSKVPEGNIIGGSALLLAMRAIVAAVRGGQTKTMAICGDSTEAALGATLRTKSPTSVAAALLQAIGLETRSDGWFGNANIDTVGFNPNWSPGTGWALLSNNFLGQKAYTTVSGDGPSTCVPSKAADRFDVYTAQLATTGTLVVNDGATTLATNNSNGANGVKKTTIVRAGASLNPITIQHNGTGPIAYILGVVPWSSTLGELLMVNCAASGAVATSISANAAAYQAKGTLDALDPDMSLIEFGLNEAHNGTPLATLIASLTTDIQQQLLRGAAALAVSCPADPASGYDLPTEWRDAIKALAASNNLPCLDFYSLFGTRAAYQSDYSDIVHLKDSGYARKGVLLRDFVLA